MNIKMLYGKSVRLYDGELNRRENENRNYMLRLEPRALMLNFEMEAGIFNTQETPKFMHGGWENPTCQLRGHFPGHWLSAAAMHYYETGDRALKAQADDMIDILERCQNENGDGWAGPIPEKYLYRIASGKNVWAPHYTLHKVFMGLVDMYKFAGSEKALAIAEKWAEWFYDWSGKYTREQFDKILDVETGGMLEIWADLYGITGKEMYLTLLDRYYHTHLFDRLLNGEDPLNNMHANTTIPEINGCARAYEVTGNEKWRRICEIYWKCAVTDRGAYVTGGQTLGEVWLPKHQMKARLGDKSQEHCTVYNMMRLADYLFRWTGDSSYIDYLERGLYNGIMAQGYWQKYNPMNNGYCKDSPDSGLLTYYLPTQAGARKAWASEKEHFFCCHGTLVQANSAHNRYIYYQDGSTVYACQYFNSEAEFEIDGHRVKLSQGTDSQSGAVSHPDTRRVNFVVHTDGPVKMLLKIRVPAWAKGVENENGYVNYDRVWNDGDQVSIELPMKIAAETMPDDENMVAFTYGPMVLAGITEEETMLHLNGKPAESVIARENEREWGWWTDFFKTVGQERGMRMIPLYRVGYEPYEIYFPVKR